MHISHLTSGDLWAGAEVMACHLLKGLQSKADIKLSVILLNDGRLADELRKAGLSPLIIHESRNSFLKLARKIRKILAADPPDIIHSHRYKENILAFIVSQSLPKIKLITTQHGLPETYAQGHSLTGKIKSAANFHILKRYFDTVAAVSDDIGSFFTNNLGFSANKIKVVHNGIEIARKTQRKPDDNFFVIGSSGRLFPVKDYPLMLNIAKSLGKEKRIHFALAGEGPEREKLEDMIREFNLAGSFHLKGHIDDMESFYQGLDVYLNTSLHEGIPMTILEAMSMGLPVIAPRVGGIPEVVRDGVEGFLVDKRNPAAFAEKCLMLFKDKELWKRMSANARQRAVKDFSVERMTEGYLRIYRGEVSGVRCQI